MSSLVRMLTLISNLVLSRHLQVWDLPRHSYWETSLVKLSVVSITTQYSDRNLISCFPALLQIGFAYALGIVFALVVGADRLVTAFRD